MGGLVARSSRRRCLQHDGEVGREPGIWNGQARARAGSRFNSFGGKWTNSVSTMASKRWKRNGARHALISAVDPSISGIVRLLHLLILASTKRSATNLGTLRNQVDLLRDRITPGLLAPSTSGRQPAFNPNPSLHRQRVVIEEELTSLDTLGKDPPSRDWRSLRVFRGFNLWRTLR